MEIATKTIESIAVVEISGEIDGKTAPIAQETIVPLFQSRNRVVLDMSKVTFMSSAGLRLMLLVQRQMTHAKGRLALVGLSAELKDTMSVTGFLPYFTTCDTLDAGIAALR